MNRHDVIIIGAGAAGMMCAIEAAKRGRSVLIVDHARAPGEKIRISGGGRCNFTNIHAAPANYFSENPHFCISALRRYGPRDFIAMIDRHGIAWHEKTLGQLFCDGSAQQIIDMLLAEMKQKGVVLRLGIAVSRIEKTADGFRLDLDGVRAECSSLVIATGGKSIPKMGATGFAYELAAQFGVSVTATRPALVPLTFDPSMLARLKPLAGVSLNVIVSCGKKKFEEAMLFTHRGLSGPAILQISSCWREGSEIDITMLPGVNLFELLKTARSENGRQSLHTVLSALLPRRLAQMIAEEANATGPLADLSDRRLREVEGAVNGWRIKPVGSEGYRTAEVTLGGVDTQELEQKTMMVKSVPGLYFIGEAVDVTGWLGGYNFQWAWSSGWSAGQAA